MTIMDIQSPVITGGRVSSPKFRASLQKSEEFAGLKDELNKFDTLRLVKQAGKDAGFTAELIELLEYYVVRTNEIDWTEGHRPICYQTVLATAQDLDISERQVRNREKALNALGALTWNDSGNFKRFGMRDKKTGAIVYAHGVDLSPLASLIPALQQKVEQKKILLALWGEEKRKISALRGRIRTLLAEAVHFDELQDFVDAMQTEYDEIAYSIRSSHGLERLKTLREKHQLVVSGLLDALQGVSKAEDNVPNSGDITAVVEENFPHIQRTTLKQFDKSNYSSPMDNGLQEGVAALSVTEREDREDVEAGKDPVAASLMELNGKITIKQALGAASSRFRDHVPITNRGADYNDLVEAAYALLPTLKINKSAWGDACNVMGRYFAAIAVMIIDQKMQDPAAGIKNSGGYLREMTKRARNGKLNLHGSVFGLLKKDGQHDA